MKKLFITILMVSAAILCFGADVSSQIKWYSGTGFPSKQPISNMTVTKLGRVFGMLKNGETVEVKDGFKVSVAGPDGYTYQGSISQPAVSEYDYDKNKYVAVPQPGIQFSCSKETYGTDVPGSYTVNIPEASFTVDGVPNDAFSVVFTVADNRNYIPTDFGFSFNPDPAIPTDKIEEITFTMNNVNDANERIYSQIGINPATKATLTREGGEAIVCEVKGASTTTSRLGYKATIPAGTSFAEAGKYTLSIPEGTIRLQSESGNSFYTNQAISIVYTITGNSQTPTGVADRIVWYSGKDSQSRVPLGTDNTIQALSMMFGMIEDGALVNVVKRPLATITGPEDYNVTGEIIQATEYNFTTGEVEKLPGFKFNCRGTSTTDINIPGEYTFSIPAGAFTVDGNPNEAFTKTVIVKDLRTYTTVPANFFTVNPATESNLNELEFFNLRFSNKDAQGNTIYGGASVKPHAYGTVTKDNGEPVKLNFKSSAAPSTDLIQYKLVITDDHVFSDPGKYVVNIPAGTMVFRSEDTPTIWYTNPELTYTYTIRGGGVADKTYTNTRPTITPAEGEILAFDGVEFESPELGAYWMYLCPEGGNNVKFTVTLPDNTVDEYEPTVSANNSYIFCPFYEVYTTPGTYKLTVPKGSFKYVDGDGKEYYTNGFELTYNVKGGEKTDMSYTLSTADKEIANDATLYNLSHIYVKFDDSVSGLKMIYSKVTYPDNSVKYARTSWSETNKRFLIDFQFPTQKGTYKVSFPAGATSNSEGKFNNGIEFTINLAETKTGEIECTTEPTNGDTVNELYTLYLNAPEGYTELKRVNGGITMSYFYNDEDRDNRQMQYLAATNSPDCLMITLDEKIDGNKPGDYTWEIPAGSIIGVKEDGSQVMATAMKFFWSIRPVGVVSVGMDKEAVYNVYDINGVSVIRNGKAEDLDNLDKGVYIINGKTFIIR